MERAHCDRHGKWIKDYEDPFGFRLRWSTWAACGIDDVIRLRGKPWLISAAVLFAAFLVWQQVTA